MLGTISADLQNKYEHLKQLLNSMDGAVVAFSGGIDSTLLFAVATGVLGEKSLGVTATSATYPERERLEAAKLAKKVGGRHLEIISEELDIPEFRQNPRNRCYYCKKELFSKLKKIAEEECFEFVLDGTNIDDSNDHRPGRKAAVELGIRSPLEEALFSKNDIRELSKNLGLPNWDKPAFACLSSRFPYGTEINKERVQNIDKAEERLFNLGFHVIRVRYHGDVARVELGEDEFEQATGSKRKEVIQIIKSSGFKYVSIDLEGYRTGAMNE